MAPFSLTGLVVFLCFTSLLQISQAGGRGRGRIKHFKHAKHVQASNRPLEDVDEEVKEQVNEEGSHRQGRRKLQIYNEKLYTVTPLLQTRIKRIPRYNKFSDRKLSPIST